MPQPFGGNSMKSSFLVIALLIAIGSTHVMADAASNIRERAVKLEARVEKDLGKGVITSDDADKYKQQLDQIENTTRGQNTEKTERRDMRTAMDRIDTALAASEAGGSPSPTP